MSRINIREQVFNLIAMFLVQIPLLYRITLGDHAFGFFYVGFLLLLPYGTSRTYLMLIGFVVGLVVDVFSNTPGIHAGACVLMMFLRDLWVRVVVDDTEDLTNVNHLTLRKRGLIMFAFPLIFVHHFFIFSVENGGLHLFGLLTTKTTLSALFSFVIVFVLNFMIVPKPRRI